MNMTLFHWKNKCARFLKIGSFATVLALSSFYSAYSSRSSGYYDEDYLDQNYHQQFQRLSLARPQPVIRNSLRQIQPYAAQSYEVPRSIPSYPARCALWLTETPAHIATRHTGTVPLTYTSATLTLTSTVGKNKISWDLSVENQGELGTCSSFAVVEAVKFLHNRLLSQPYLIVKAEALENCLNDGLTIGSAMNQIKLSGVVGQQWWPYPDYVETVKSMNKGVSTKEKWNVCMAIPQNTIKQEDELIKFGAGNTINLFANSIQKCTGGKCTFDKSDLIKKAMTNYKVPVVIGVPVEWNAEWSQSGNISSGLKNIVGNHAITLYGYDDQLGVFFFKNSWGTNWGRNGLGTISFKFIQQYAHEAWIAYEKTMKQ